MTRHAVIATKATTQSFAHLLKIGYFGVLVTSGRGAVDPWLAAMMVVLAFTGTEGSATGSLLPTGNVRDSINGIEVTCVDNGMPVVLLNAAKLVVVRPAI